MQKNLLRVPVTGQGSRVAVTPVTRGIESKPGKVLLICDDYQKCHRISASIAEAAFGAFAVEYTDQLPIGMDTLARGGIDVIIFVPGPPGTQRREILARLHAQAPKVPIVIVAPGSDEIHGLDLPMNDAREFVVNEPADGNLLVSCIHRAIERQRTMSQVERQTRKLESHVTNLYNIIRTFADGIVVVDPRGVVCFANPAAEAIFSCKTKQLLGKQLDFIPKLEGKTKEITVTAADGKTNIVEVRVAKTEYRGEIAYLASLRDITGRKLAEEDSRLALEEAEATRQAIEKALSKAKEGKKAAKEEAEATKQELTKALADARQETENTRKAMEKAISKAREEKKIAKEEAEATKQELSKALDKAREETLLAREDAETTKDALAEAIRKAEEENRLAREETEAVKRAMSEALSKAQEQIRRAQEETKTTRNAMGETLERARQESRLAKEETGKTKKSLEEASNKIGEGVERAEEAARKIERVELEKAAIAESLNRLQEDRKQAEDILCQSDRNQSAYISNVLHELRTPLHSIIGFTRLILEGKVTDGETQEEFLTIINKQSEHLRDLIDKLVDVSDQKSDYLEIQKKRISINVLIQRAIESAAEELSLSKNKKNIVISQDIPATLPEIAADEKRLKQVMFNLLDNAVKFSEDGSQVKVKAEVKSGKLAVAVSDHGVGIAEEDMPTIFERYYRARDPAKTEKLGLGLYISKQIIEAHGGHIWVESIKGEGSTFIFTLPLD